jgi:hypothetical protein
MREDLFLIPGVTPGFTIGQTSYSNSALKYWSYSVELRGVGTLQPGTDINFLTDGGFEFVNGGYVIEQNIDCVLHFYKYSPIASTSNYTNGIDINSVLPELENRIGWRQPKKAGSPVLNSYNKTSKSGRFFDSFHTLVNANNIKYVQEDDQISDADLNQYLSDLQDDAIMRTLSEVFRESSLIEQKLLYTRFGTMDLPIVNSGLFVGYMINIANDFGITTQINNCTLYFDGAKDFNLYLFQDGVLAPLKTIPVHVDPYVRNEVPLNNLYLNYKTGRRYFIGYFQDDLGPVHAIQEQVDTWATMLCFEARPFAAPRVGQAFDFNHNYKQYTALPRGINLEVITFRDHTQQILRKANLFDEAVGLSVTVMVLELINMAIRSNVKERQLKMVSGSLYQEINQAYATDAIPVTPGIKSRMFSEFKKLRESFYPQIKSDSMARNRTMKGLDGYESNWIKNNIDFVNNPPMMQT